MKPRRIALKNLMLLLGLIVVVSMTLISLFKAYSYSVRTSEKLEAHLMAQSLVEYGKEIQVEETRYFYYDKAWNGVEDLQGAEYIAELVIKSDDLQSQKLKSIQVNVYKEEVAGGHVIYSLSAKIY